MKETATAITSIRLPEEIIDYYRNNNINISGVCRKLLEQDIKERTALIKKNTTRRVESNAEVEELKPLALKCVQLNACNLLENHQYNQKFNYLCEKYGFSRQELLKLLDLDGGGSKW